MSEKVTKEKVPALAPEVREACADYSKLAKRAISAAEKAEDASWARAAGALAVKKACKKHDVKFLAIVAAECDVSRPVATMDVKAEEMRIYLKITPPGLAAGSLSGMYELHRGSDAALTLAGKDDSKKKAAEKKIRDIGGKIAAGEMSSRDVRREFADEIRRAREQRIQKGGRKKQKHIANLAMPVPLVQSLEVKELTAMVETLAKSSKESIPVVTVRPSKATAKSVEACLGDPKTRAEIATACPREGGFWIYVDLTPKAKEEPAEGAAA